MVHDLPEALQINDDERLVDGTTRLPGSGWQDFASEGICVYYDGFDELLWRNVLIEFRKVQTTKKLYVHGPPLLLDVRHCPAHGSGPLTLSV